MSAWIEKEGQEHQNIEKEFEDNFVTSQEFKKLDDSEEYLKLLGNKLN
jgi:hypothetical protein